MTHDTEGLRNVVQSIIESHKDDERLSPAAIAAEAVAKLGLGELQLAANFHLRQIARQACRKTFGEEEDDALDPDQQELFPGLQSRYPAARRDDGEATYVLRDSMSGDDVAWNVQRLRREGNTKLGRADALEGWWQARRGLAISPAA